MKTIYSCAEDVEQVSLTIRTYEELVEACTEKELLAKDAVRGEKRTIAMGRRGRRRETAGRPMDSTGFTLTFLQREHLILGTHVCVE
eukprot:7252675-Pyramimonas_sp.AAC.2